MKITKKFLSIIAVMLLTALIFSLGTFSASAQADTMDHDIFGVPIDSDMVRDFGPKGIEHLYLNLEVENDLGLFIFIDEELLSYTEFLEHLINAILYKNPHIYAPGTNNEERLAALAVYNIRLFVYRGNNLFEELSYGAYNLINGTDYPQYFDFTISDYRDWLYSYVNNAYMCAFGFWSLPTGLSDMLLGLQGQWENGIPLYMIFIDPVNFDPNGLILLIYTWNGLEYDIMY